jgi:hypothetical protein
MAQETKRISELEESTNIYNSDLMEITSPASAIYFNYLSQRSSIENFSNWLCSIFNFSTQLQTKIKTIIGAINEIFNKDKEPAGAGFHNSIYRGKWLGEYPTEKQLEAIENGTFKDLFIGDYWSGNSGINYRIAAFDYYYGIGEKPCDKHHVVIVPDQTLNLSGSRISNRGGYTFSTLKGYRDWRYSTTTSKENETVFYSNLGIKTSFICCVYTSDPTVDNGIIYWDIAEEPTGDDNKIKIKGGKNFHPSNPNSTFNSNGIPKDTDVMIVYLGKYPSYSYGLINSENIVEQTFTSKNNILNFPLLATIDSTNQPSLITTKWINGRVEIMTEQQCYGARTAGVDNNFETDIIYTNGHFQYNRKRFETTVDSIQFPLFKFNPVFINANNLNNPVWLRDKYHEEEINWTDSPAYFENGKEKTGICQLYSTFILYTDYSSEYLRPYFCLYKGT